MSSFSPGPWEVQGTVGDTVVVADGDSVVASLRDRYGASVEHDARLIAASPALLKALRDIGGLASSPDGSKAAMDRALTEIEWIVHSALAKVGA